MFKRKFDEDFVTFGRFWIIFLRFLSIFCSTRSLKSSLKSECDFRHSICHFLLRQLVRSQRLVEPNSKSIILRTKIDIWANLERRRFSFLSNISWWFFFLNIWRSRRYWRVVSRQNSAAPSVPQAMPRRAEFKQANGPVMPSARGNLKRNHRNSGDDKFRCHLWRKIKKNIKTQHFDTILIILLTQKICSSIFLQHVFLRNDDVVHHDHSGDGGA